MGFRPVNFKHLAKFNSAASSDFLDLYLDHWNNELAAERSKIPHRTFAPSSFRCDRRSWFRLRGTPPDTIKHVDTQLDFTAKIGTACHRIIQQNLREILGDCWIDVNEYISEAKLRYQCNIEYDNDSGEYLVSIQDPPVRFAVDGIVKINDIIYLLEIKTCEYSSFNDLLDPKEQHIDQVKFYGTILDIHNVLFLYQDRQYGNLKCYEYNISDTDMIQIRERISRVKHLSEINIPPEKLPAGDPWCNENHCPYSKKCKEW